MQDENPPVLQYAEPSEVVTLDVVARNPTETGFRTFEQSTESNLTTAHASIEAAIDAFKATLVPDANAGCEPPLADAISTMAPETRAAEIPEIRCNQRDQNWMSVAAIERKALRRGWLFAGAFVGIFCLGWVGGSISSRFIEVGAALEILEQKLKPFAKNLGVERTPGITIERAGANNTDKPTLDVLSARKESVFATIAPDSGYRPPSNVARLPRAPLAPVSRAQENSPYPSAAAKTDERVLPRLTPMPQTRPVTIEGWTVRQVHGGTAVLEGPGGVWRAARGETVPGVGRIDSIVLWGGRWIVSTTKGLITTQ
jgi:hypothetical protein